MSPADLRPLEAVARRIASEWGLELGEPFVLALHSYAAPAGDGAVLKLTPDVYYETDHEGDALAHWHGDGAVRLLRHDRERRALLLERAVPGTDISGLPEIDATAIAAEVGTRLWRPAAKPFRWIGDYLPRWLEEGSGELQARARQLLGSMKVGRETLVHGDFHHQNILASHRGHLAIDPQPFLGEPEFDIAPFLWNPLPIGLRLDVLASRLAAFSAVGLDEDRIRAWTVIRGSYLLPEDAEALLALV